MSLIPPDCGAGRFGLDRSPLLLAHFGVSRMTPPLPSSHVSTSSLVGTARCVADHRHESKWEQKLVLTNDAYPGANTTEALITR